MLSRRAFVVVPSIATLHGQLTKTEMFGNAGAYERFMGRWSRVVAPHLADFAGLPERGRVLDAGSGTGSMAFAIAGRMVRSRIVGIDPSKEYVAFATSRNQFPDRVTFEVGDAQSLRFADAEFDAAVSLLVFNFIPDAGKALLELLRVTRSGGTLSAAVWDYGEGMRMLRTFWDAAVAIDPAADRFDEKRMPLCREGELSKLWKQGRLGNVRERSIDVDLRFASFADYWDPFLLGQGPAGSYIRGAGRDKVQALRGEVKSRLSVSVEDAPLVLPARVWAVRGDVPGRA